jgi:hypothetical protein
VSFLSPFARKKNRPVEVVELPKECGHFQLAPKWDQAADIGKADRIVSLTCTVCQKIFTPEEARDLAPA